MRLMRLMRRPMWLGAGIVVGVGGTVWAEQRVRRRVRRTLAWLSPAVARSEAADAARELKGRVRDALDVARAEQRRSEAELWRRMGEPPPGRHPHARSSRVLPSGGRPTGARRQHR
jgi:hypothetical protein